MPKPGSRPPDMAPIKRLKTQHYTVRELGIVLEVRGLKTLSLRCRLARPLFILAAAVAGLPVEIAVTTNAEAHDPSAQRSYPPTPAKDD